MRQCGTDVGAGLQLEIDDLHLCSEARLETARIFGFMQVSILVEVDESSAQGVLQSISDAWPCL